MKCEAGRLHAYLDEVLPPVERDALTAHLVTCARCRTELAAIQARGARLDATLSLLNPAADHVPDPALALRRFRVELRAPPPQSRLTGSGIWDRVKWSMTVLKKSFFAGQRRPFAFGATALACVLILFSFAPVRQAAADFLGVFRVRKFAVIPVDPAQITELERLAELAETGMFGEPVLAREPTDPQAVADVAEASAVVGFSVREPTQLPDGAVRTKLAVEFGPAMHYEIDRAMMEQLLAVAGVSGVTLPDVDKVAVDVDIPPAVVATYQYDGRSIHVMQLPSPEVAMPAGVNPAVFGEIGLQMLGMPAAEAARVAQQIDWASTLILPLPTDIAKFRPVTVDGVEGLLVEESTDGGANRVLIWQRGGYVYSVRGRNVRGEELLQAANSLQ